MQRDRRADEDEPGRAGSGWGKEKIQSNRTRWEREREAWRARKGQTTDGQADGQTSKKRGRGRSVAPLPTKSPFPPRHLSLRLCPDAGMRSPFYSCDLSAAARPAAPSRPAVASTSTCATAILLGLSRLSHHAMLSRRVQLASPLLSVLCSLCLFSLCQTLASRRRNFPSHQTL